MREIIRKIDVFTGLDEKLLRRIADSAILCNYSPDEIVIREGEMGIGMYFILRGRVAVVRNLDGSQVRLAEIGPNQFFAEMALIDEKPRSATVLTMETTECLLFTRDTFLRLMEKHPSLSIRLARVLAERLRLAQDNSLPLPAVVPASNGVVPAAATDPVDDDIKAQIQKKLIDTFEMLYTLKAFARFSVAILGCPVEPSGAQALETIRIGDVKAVMLPAAGRVQISIDAYAAGVFQLHVLCPSSLDCGKVSAVRFDPIAIRPHDGFTLSLPELELVRRERAGGEARA